MRKILTILTVVMVLGLLTVPAFAFGGLGMGINPRGVANGLEGEDLAKWLQEQVDGGWITQKQADLCLEKEKFKKALLTEEDFAAYIDQRVQDGWLTEKQAELAKERYQEHQERREEKRDGNNSRQRGGREGRKKGGKMPVGMGTGS